MSILPQELIIKILYLLPVKSLVRFQVVSKLLHALINDLNFIKMHLQCSIETQKERFLMQWSIHCPQIGMLEELPNDDWLWESLRVSRFVDLPEGFGGTTNHCDGLFCYYNDSNEIVVWNPSIRKHKKLPPVQRDAFDLRKLRPMIAIGYDAVNNDYKVLSIGEVYKPETLTGASDIQVYSLKEDLWTRVEDEWPYFENSCFNKEGTYSNGNLYWLVTVQTGEASSQEILVAFDLTIEKFRVHALPSVSLLSTLLRTLGGLPCLSTTDDLWMMKEFGVASSWTRLSMPPKIFSSYIPLVISKDGQEILLEDIRLHNLVWYNRVKKTWRTVEVLGIPKGFWSTPCQGSLVLLNGDNDD